MAYAYNPSYLAGKDQEDWGLRPARPKQKKVAGHGGTCLPIIPTKLEVEIEGS
jgi:hypothetical protein